MGSANKNIDKKTKRHQTPSDNMVIKTAGMMDGQLLEKPHLKHGAEYSQRKCTFFLRTLKRDYKRLAIIYRACIEMEQERKKRNEEEIDDLRKIYNQMQIETANIKRTRWCRYCESEATFLSSIGTNFYCSQECEQKQNELISALTD